MPSSPPQLPQHSISLKLLISKINQIRGGNQLKLITYDGNRAASMKKLIKGLREFQTGYFSQHQDLFEQLSHGQKPRVLFIACSDSRVDPNLITQAQVGELFVIRNAGNLIPPFGAANGGEGAAVEYAVHALGIEQVIVCGHSHCGAMKGLLKLSSLEEEMPLVYEWLKHAEATRRVIREHYNDRDGEELLEATIAENVITQLENLKTYPVIHSKLHKGNLSLHGWVYSIETGQILAYDPEEQEFLPPHSKLAPPPPPKPAFVEDDLSVYSWLPREQANRIYRGSY